MSRPVRPERPGLPSGILIKMPTNWTRQVASDEILELAYRWMCERRKNYSADQDVWDVRWRWAEIKPRLQRNLLAGRFRLEPVRQLQTTDGKIELWSALDALVLKAIAIVLSRRLRFSDACYHVAGRGGAKAAVRHVTAKLDGQRFVFRSDVKSYYASIDHNLLLQQLREQIDDPLLLDLLEQYVRRTIYDAGLYETVERGISLGCPLSPLMGALYLQRLDERVENTGLVYARFMDDWVILAPTRWKLRKAVRIVNRTLAELKVEQHPGKTFVGYIERAFDFLGYQIFPNGLGVARQARENFVARVHRLYEQGADSSRIGEYVRRWLRWVRSGLDSRLAGQLFLPPPSGGTDNQTTAAGQCHYD